MTARTDRLNAKTGKRYADWGANGAIDLTKVGYDRAASPAIATAAAPSLSRRCHRRRVPAPATDYLNEE
jgi:hypothetical protein